MSGSRSTRSWLYENRPSTQSAAITIVAKTGLLIETRVNHMAVLAARDQAGRARVAGAEADAGRGRGRGAAALRDDQRRRAFLEVVEAHRRAPGVGHEALDHLDAAGRRIAPPGDDDAAHQRAVLDRPDEVLARGLADGAGRHRHALARVGELDPGLRVLAGAKALALVVEDDDDADRPRAGLGGRRDPVDPARHRRRLALDPHLRPPGPAASSETSCVPTEPASSSVDRSTTVTIGCSGAHLLARHDVALADDARDRRGERRLADADARRRRAAPRPT